MNNRSISATLSIDQSERGRPVRTRKPPTILYNPHPTHGPPPTRRRHHQQQQQAEPQLENHRIDTLARTRGAKQVIGNIDDIDCGPPAPHDNHHQNHQSNNSHYSLGSEDKDADGEDDDGGDEDEEDDYPSLKTQQLTIDSEDESITQVRPSITRKNRRKRIEEEERKKKKKKKNQKLENLAKQRAGIRRSARNAGISFGVDGNRNQSSNKHIQEGDEGRQLRNRKHVDYHIPALDAYDPTEDNKGGKGKKDQNTSRIRLPMNMSGKQMDRLFGHQRPGGGDSDEEPTPAFGRASGAGILAGNSTGHLVHLC
ncbi:hypothetical protein KEM48_008661 [Puccinia striiformis f. sp. tritici PST-130]|nr:hypothetical protein KEM48_008661 [Puccinia striiformis f. sp. tritici PST-130]